MAGANPSPAQCSFWTLFLCGGQSLPLEVLHELKTVFSVEEVEIFRKVSPGVLEKVWMWEPIVCSGCAMSGRLLTSLSQVSLL